jgi:hypothetical protein
MPFAIEAEEVTPQQHYFQERTPVPVRFPASDFGNDRGKLKHLF